MVAGICLAAAAFVLPSCKKYLEVEPVSSFGPDYVFNSVVNARTAVIGAYANLGGDNGYGIRLSMYYPFDTDEMMGQGGTPYPDNERRDIAHYSLNSGNTQLASPFNQLYNGIERANICIYNIPRMALYTTGTAAEQKELKRLHGESLTLRAQYYLELVRNWGDLPAQWQPSSFESDLFKAKTSRDTIYAHLLDDLKAAETLVPWRTEVTQADERITQGAIRALRARIALFAGGYSLRQDRTMKRPANYKDLYQIAKDECSAVMQRRDQHKLNTTFQAVFKDVMDAHRIDPNGEVMFEVAMTGGSTSTGDSKLGYYNGPRYSIVSGTSTTNVGNAALTILPTYFYTFDSTDTRRDVTVAAYDNFSDNSRRGRTLQSLVDGKFRRDWITNPTVLTSQAQYFGLNWPLIRFSDVLLMYAEADNELGSGPSAAAIGAFEEVRKRAYGTNGIGATPAAYTDFFNALVKERLLEFGGEGIRKYDLIRWNLLAQKLADTKTALTALAGRQGVYANLPVNMYYKQASADLVWAGSYYKPSPFTSAPSGYTSVAWAGSAVTTTIGMYFAAGFVTGKSELLPIPQASIDANPMLKQDYGY